MNKSQTIYRSFFDTMPFESTKELLSEIKIYDVDFLKSKIKVGLPIVRNHEIKSYIKELDNKSLEIRIDAPGSSKELFNITCEDTKDYENYVDLAVKWTRLDESDSKEKKEYVYTTVLGESYDVSKIKAIYINGVLILNVPIIPIVEKPINKIVVE